jgi:excisionase family DNA binding protein
MNGTVGGSRELSAAQAAAALGVSLMTIRRWSEMGYLTSHRTASGRRRFSETQIREFINSLQRRPAALNRLAS